MDSWLGTLKSITAQLDKIIKSSRNAKLTDALNRILRRLQEAERFVIDRRDTAGKPLTAKKVGYYMLKTYRMTQERNLNNVLMKFMPGQYRMMETLFGGIDKLSRQLLGEDYKKLRRSEADVGVIHAFLVKSENAFRAASQQERIREKAVFLQMAANEMRTITAMIYLGRNPDKSVCSYLDCVKKISELWIRLEGVQLEHFFMNLEPDIIATLQEVKDHYLDVFRYFVIRKQPAQEDAVRAGAAQPQSLPSPARKAPAHPAGMAGPPARGMTPVEPAREKPKFIPLKGDDNREEPRPQAPPQYPQGGSAPGRRLLSGAGPGQPPRPGQAASPPSPFGFRGVQQKPPQADEDRRPQRASGPIRKASDDPPQVVVVAEDREIDPPVRLASTAILKESPVPPEAPPVEGRHPHVLMRQQMQSSQIMRGDPEVMGAPAKRPDGFFREVNRERPSPLPPRTPLTNEPPKPKSFEDEVISLLDKSRRPDITSRLPDPKTSFLRPDALNKPRSFLSEAIKMNPPASIPLAGGRPQLPSGKEEEIPGIRLATQPPQMREIPVPRQEGPISPGSSMTPPAQSREEAPPAQGKDEGISIADIVKKSKEEEKTRKPGCLPAFIGSGLAALFLIFKLLGLFIR
jgi:hypothetical protein